MPKKKKKILLSEAVQMFLEWSKDLVTANTWKEDHKYRLESFEKKHSGFWIHNFSLEDIEKYRSLLCRKGLNKKGKGLAASSVNGHMKTVKSLFNRMIELGYIDVNPCNKLARIPELDSEYPPYLSRDEVKSLLKAASEHKHHPIFALISTALFAGLRRGELINLEWANLCFDKDIIKVRNTETFKVKNFRERSVPIHPKLKVILQGLTKTSKFVFTNKQGNPYSVAVRESADRIFDKAKLNHCSMHMLRHTFATHAIFNGVDVKTLQKWLGHSQLETTLRYTHALEGMEQELMNKLVYIKTKKAVA